MATKTGNPFLDQDFSNIFDFKRYADQFQVPGLDSKALIEAQRKNIEAITQANRVAFEGMQAVAQRQGEILRQAMDESVKAMQDVGTANAPEDRVSKQTEIAKNAFETAIKNMRELAEMSAKSQTEALDLINTRVTEGFDEIRNSVAQATKEAQKAATAKSA
ncbi:phasin family protein [Ferruginivarius sediminum]|uniref:Phasin family protein n=1 Tax=Ferruginivarius sediminum TaxID=2661937 RepID=A0A369T7N7_9PROT|nr:phasin family protein [Ferruginivarius sediminum]RDD60892.1 phasin family protein [Ferruginivarius sediminum]